MARRPASWEQGGNEYDYLFKQGGAHRRLRRGEVQPALPLHQEQLRPRFQVHHWRRVRHPHPPVVVKMPRRGKKAGKKKFIWQGRNAFELLPLPSGVPQPMCFCSDPCKVEFNEDEQDEETYLRRYWMCANFAYEPTDKMRLSGWLTPPPLCDFHQWIDLEVSPEAKARLASLKRFDAKFKVKAEVRRREEALKKEHRDEEEMRRAAAAEEERERKKERARRAKEATEENPDALRKRKWPRCTQ